MVQSPKLGQGLSALLGPSEAQENENLEKGLLSLDLIKPSAGQPRKYFDDDAMTLLVDSIKQSGVLQPLLVRPIEEEHYMIVAGERRWRASKLAGLQEVPVVIKSCTDEEALTLGLVENIQRESLNVIEEAEGYQKLYEEFYKTQEEIAQLVGKSRSHVANTLRLLALPASVKSMVERGDISTGHARAILGHEEPELLARKIIQEGWSVRQVEDYQRRLKSKPYSKEGLTSSPNQELNGTEKFSYNTSHNDQEVAHMEENLRQSIGLPVKLRMTLDGGSLTIYFKDLPQMDALIQKLS